MALLKTLQIRGYDVSYWHIAELTYSKRDNITRATLRGYGSKAMREDSIENYFPESSLTYVLDGRLNEGEIYAALKLPMMRRTITSPAVAEERSMAGEILVEAKPEEYFDEDINVLTDAVDDI